MFRIIGGIVMTALACAWTTPAAAADARLPVPTAESMTRSQSRIREVFADDLEQAKTAAEKSELSRRLAEQAASTTEPGDRFMLLIASLDKAIEAGDAAAACGLIDRLPREFALPSDTWRLESVARLAAKAGPASVGEVTDLCLAIGRESYENGSDEAATKAASLAASLAKRAKDGDRLAQASRLQQKLKQRQAIEKELRPLLDAVAANPTDPTANTQVGVVLCLKAERWADGLPLLAKGGDRALRDLATAELKLADNAADRVQIADRWWLWAEEQKPAWKAAGKARASHHYERAVNSLTGLERTRVEKRLATASRLGGGSGQTVFLADLPEKTAAGHVMFSKDGKCFGQPFTLAGKNWPKAITALPKAKSFSSVAYPIPPAALRCRGSVGIFTPATAKPGEKPGSPLMFRLVVDGDVVWQSPPLRNLGDSVAFDVDLDGGRVLELQTAVADSDWCCWGTWLDPMFVK